MKRFFEFATVFGIGGVLYSMVEILWRGYTHWSMTLTGGVCFLVLYALHVYAVRVPFLVRCFLGALAITAAEFLAGCIVNLWLRWEVWDYSDVPFNILGQVCPLFSFLWLLLGAAAAPICWRLAGRIAGEIPRKNSRRYCNGGGVGI